MTTTIRFPQGPIVDQTTGMLSLEWFEWLQNPQFVSISFATGIDVPSGGTGQTSLTAHGVIIGEGTSAVNVTAAGTTGTVLKGVTGADPVFGTLSGSDITGAALTRTNDTNVTLTLGGSPTTALLNAASLTLGWSGQLGVSRGGTGLATLTAHALYVGNGTSSPTALAVGSTNQFLKGSTGADPAFGTATLASADFANQGTTTTVLHGDASGNPSWSAISLTADVTGTLAVGNGGSGATSFTAHGVMLGNGSSAMGVTAVGSTNTVLHGNTGADPTYSAVVEADITLADNTTNNVSTSKHGFAPKAPNDATKYLDGTGAYSVPSGAGVSGFTSSDQTITSAGSLTLAHGLSSTPTAFGLFLKCTTAESGYSVGDKVVMTIGPSVDASGNSHGVSIVPDATNLNIRFGSNTSAFMVNNKSGGGVQNLTNSSWVAIFKAWVL